MKKDKVMYGIRIYGLFALCAVLFAAYFSTSTSPFYSGFGADSAIFQIMGKYWAEGEIPYVDTFDHKGPYIFAVNALGYFLTGNKIGVCLLQSIHLFFTLVGIYKIGQLFFAKKTAFGWSLLSLGFLSLSYEGGNLTEEYTLPFLAFSIYFQYKFLLNFREKTEEEHNWKYSIFYGITFIICAFTRLTNALGLCCGIFIILLFLMKEKKWGNIGKNILGVFIGMALAAAPFLLYFTAKGAFYELIMGSFLLNFNMVGTVTNYWWSTPHSLIAWIRIIVAHLCSYGLIVGGALMVMRRKREEAVYLIFIGAVMTLYLVTRYAFYHYSIITLPYLPIVVMTIKKGKKGGKLLGRLLALGICLFTLYQSLAVYRDFIKAEEKLPEYAHLLEMVPEEERSSFIAYNVKADIYLRYDINPYYTYFHHQDYHASRNVDVQNSIRSQFAEGRVKWILFQENENENCISEILEAQYDLIKTDGEYSLFCRRETK